MMLTPNLVHTVAHMDTHSINFSSGQNWSQPGILSISGEVWPNLYTKRTKNCGLKDKDIFKVKT